MQEKLDYDFDASKDSRNAFYNESKGIYRFYACLQFCYILRNFPVENYYVREIIEKPTMYTFNIVTVLIINNLDSNRLLN